MTRASLFPDVPAAQSQAKVASARLWPALLVLGVTLVGVTGLIGAIGAVGSAPASADLQQRAASPSAAGTPVEHMAATKSAAAYPAAPAPRSEAAPSNSVNSIGAGAGPSARIEQTGTITLVVKGDQIQFDLNRLTGLAVGNGGFVASTATQSAVPGSPAQGTVTLQVPVGNFPAVLAEVKTLGKVASLQTTAVDVTGQYEDLQAQITALEDSRQQYLTIMTKATTIGGILAVQSQLDDIQDQLDQLQGQLKLLDSETTYSTLVVTLTQRLVTPPPPAPPSGLLRAWRAAVGGFVAGCEGVIRLAGPALFALLVIAALVLSGRLAWRLTRRSA
jgi:Domain of unknown function (DUF4349)